MVKKHFRYKSIIESQYFFSYIKMLSLPTEIITIIAYFLELKERAKLREVNMALNKLLSDHRLWKILIMNLLAINLNKCAELEISLGSMAHQNF